MGFNLDDYETVEERLYKFWKEYPDGRVETELIEATPSRFIVMARLFRTEADQRYWVSGLAFENVTDRGVNATSALENCETSAIGRALANAGYATRGKRASREEMDKVKRNIHRTETRIQVEKPSDPWTVEIKEMPLPVSEAVTALNDGIQPEEIPMCKHGAMTLKEGIGKTNKPYHGYICNGYLATGGDSQCPPIWYNLNKAGQWKPQVAKPEQAVIQ